MRIWDGTISRGQLARILGVEIWRSNEVAESLKVKTLNGQYEIREAKRIAARFVVVGKPEEVERAKVALRGPLRGDVDPRAFNDREQYEP